MTSRIEAFTTPPARVLVIRLSALGDVVHCLPALEALHELWPDARLDWVSESSGGAALEGHPLLARVVVLPRKRWRRELRRPRKWPRLVRECRAFLRRLRAERYDLIVDFQGNLRSLALSWFVRGGRRVTHHRREVKEYAWLGARRPDVPAGRVLRPAKYLHLVRALGWRGTCEPAGRLPHASGGAPPRGDRPILLHPFASAHGRFKEWPADYFADLARRLRARGHEVWVTWGPGEEARAREIVARSGGAASLARATAGPRDLSRLLGGASLVVAADTGPLHLAAISGLPVVGLYGPKDPRIYAPWAADRIVLRAQIPCSPCNLRSCEHAVCMQLISPAEAERAVEELLARSTGLRYKAPLPAPDGG